MDNGFSGAFSGLLGGVLNGDTWSSTDGRSCRGAREPVSGCENTAGLAGIFGFSARFAGGGNDVLFSFRSAGLLRLFAEGIPGDSRSVASAAGTDDPNCGVTGRA
jgi:hypothetical protein